MDWYINYQRVRLLLLCYLGEVRNLIMLCLRRWDSSFFINATTLHEPSLSRYQSAVTLTQAKWNIERPACRSQERA